MWFIADLNTIQTWIQLESEFKSEHWKWLGSQRMRAKRSAKKKKLRSIVQSSRENCQFFTKSPLFHFHTFLYIFFAHYNSNQVKSSEISIFISFFRIKFRSTEIHLQKNSLKIFRFFFSKSKTCFDEKKKTLSTWSEVDRGCVKQIDDLVFLLGCSWTGMWFVMRDDALVTKTKWFLNVFLRCLMASTVTTSTVSVMMSWIICLFRWRCVFSASHIFLFHSFALYLTSFCLCWIMFCYFFSCSHSNSLVVPRRCT